MKNALYALLGSLLSTLAVVIGGGRPALLVALGFATAVGLFALAFRLIGRPRIVQWLTAGAGQPAKQGTRQGVTRGDVRPSIDGSGRHSISSQPGNSERSSRRNPRQRIYQRTRLAGKKPVTDEMLARRYDRISGKRKREMELDLWAAAFESEPKAVA